jgi:transposase
LVRIERQAGLIGELTACVAQRDDRIAELEGMHESDVARLAALEALVGELAAKLGRDSSNSSKPPGSDGPGSRADRRAAQKQRRQDDRQSGGAGKERGGQAGHAGRGLELTADPDDRQVIDPPVCDGCGGDLASAVRSGAEVLQVIDVPEVRALVVEYLLVARRCGCGTVTKGRAPAGVAGGPVCYGPNLAAAAALLHAHGQVSRERAAELIAGLYGVPVSTGWINKLAARLADGLGGFEDDLKTALLAEPVMLGDETPTNTIEDSPEHEGQAGRAFHPYVFTLRTENLVWLGAGHTRGHAALDAFGLIDRYAGTFVSDDYNGYAKYERHLKARQLCNAHLIRAARGVHEGDPKAQGWAAVMIEVLRAGRQAVLHAQSAGRDRLDAGQIQEIRDRYLAAAEAGIARNRGKRTSKGDKHPARVLAQRFHDKIDQILHHLTDFAVPWTSNLAEQALRHVKIHLKISGCFRTLATTRAYCRIQSYLATTRLHGVPAMTAIRAALAGHAWTPLRPISISA